VKTNLTHYRKIFKDVDTRDIVSLYLLHGPENYIMEKMAERIASTIVPADLKAFNHTVAYGSEMKIDEFIATASSFPFLSERSASSKSSAEAGRSSSPTASVPSPRASSSSCTIRLRRGGRRRASRRSTIGSRRPWSAPEKRSPSNG
jgi:hypothetical protein